MNDVQMIRCDFCPAETEYGAVGTAAIASGWLEVPGGWRCPDHDPELPCDVMVATFV